jgi:tetratricopeptide (TPR) repeat protein/tRNA A-37 threonylcarbamoyl transferase component Bud32
MTPERWRAVKAVVQAALETPPEERPRVLGRLCGTDDTLRREAESLLGSAEVADSFLDGPAIVDDALGPPSGAIDSSGILQRLTTALTGRYALERELGQGGMATVYFARDLKHKRPVALKVLHPHLSAMLGAGRFRGEIETVANLNHPHILALHDSGEADGLLYYVMPFVTGGSLRDRIRREGPLVAGDALKILREVADALDYAHRRGTIHRDVKPENVLLDEGGHALIADFGIARAVQQITAGVGPEVRTQTGAIVGTPAYMSPEQIAGERAVDGRTDMYSLACVAFELLSGEPPFRGQSAPALAQRLTQPPPPITSRRAELPSRVDAVFARALTLVPGERFGTVSEFVAALDESLAVPTGPSAASVVPPRRLTLPKALAVYAAAVIAVAALAWAAVAGLGLPDWVLPGALMVMAAGLPVVVVAALVQRQALGRSSDGGVINSRVHRYVTLRRVALGGAMAIGAFAASVAGFMLLRAFGIGPAATLLSAGLIQPRERIIVADFVNRTADSVLGPLVTEAFRIDIQQSRAVSLVSTQQVAEALQRMQHAPTALLTPEVAREVAVREGFKAVVTGEIAAAGPRFVLSARLVSARAGEVLAAQRETAQDSTELIDAVDRLSGRLREKLGESLKAIRAEPRLEQVTTTSLDALRNYTMALHAGDHEGDVRKARSLLLQAIELDSGFAMAHSLMAVYSGDMAIILSEYEKALANPGRLTERERLLTLANFYLMTTAFEPAAVTFRTLLENYPNDREALNNLGVTHNFLEEYARAEPVLHRAIALDSSFWQAWVNLARVQLVLRKAGEAAATGAMIEKRFPDNFPVGRAMVQLSSAAGDYAGAETRARAFFDQYRAAPFTRVEAAELMALIAATRGRLAEADRYLQGALDDLAGLEEADGYLREAITQAFLHLQVRHDTTRALRQLDAAIVRYPLDSIAPANAPYLPLVAIYARAGAPGRARALLAQFERAASPEIRRVKKGEAPAISALIAIAEGRHRDAIAEYRRQEATVCGTCFFRPVVGRTLYADIARAYEVVHEPDSAVVMYERDLAVASLERLDLDAYYLAGTHQRLGELYEARGDREKATQHYAKFVELWKDCDPELRPVVAEARRRLASLSRGSNDSGG